MATLIQERSTWWVVSGGANPYEDGDYRYYWRISYEQSDTDKQNNQSQLIIDYYIQKHKGTSVYADVSSYPSGTSIVNIDGSEWGRFTTSAGSLVVGDSWVLSYIGTKKKAIPHNTDGSKSFTFQASGFGKGTSTSTYTLPKIDRGSVLGNIPTFNVDAGVTIPVTKYVTSYYDVLTVICKDTNNLTNIKTIKTYNNFSNNQKVEFTDSELNQIYTHQTKGSSTMISFELRTYTNSNKSTQIGGTSTKNVSASLTIVYPTMGSYNYADVNPVTLALTGNKPKYIVKGLSTLQISIPQEMESIANTRGSSIAYYLADETKISYNAQGSSGTILNYNKDHVEVKAVDTRGDASGGLITWFEDEGKFINYVGVSKNDDQSYFRSTDGQNEDGIGPFVNISFSGQWWQGNFGGTNNTLTASYKFKKSYEQDYKTGLTKLNINISTANKFTCNQFIAGDGNEGEFDISEIYDIIVIVKDSAGSFVEYTYSVHAGEPAIALYKNKAALGAAYDEYLGGTQMWGDIYVNGDKYSDIKKHAVSAILSDYYITTFQAWSGYNIPVDNTVVVGDKLSFDSTNHRIVVGKGVSKIKVSGSVFFCGRVEDEYNASIMTAEQLRAWYIVYNASGQIVITIPAYMYSPAKGTNIIVPIPETIAEVDEGYYVVLNAQISTTSTVCIIPDGTTLYVEVME